MKKNAEKRERGVTIAFNHAFTRKLVRAEDCDEQ